MIEVDHGDGVVTRYQSVTDIKVAVGDEVKQGDVLATASKSQINEEAGTHVHFEIRKDNVAVNPIEFMDKQVSAIQTKADPSDKEVKAESAKDKVTKEPSTEVKRNPSSDVKEKPTQDPAKGKNSGSNTKDNTTSTPGTNTR